MAPIDASKPLKVHDFAFWLVEDFWLKVRRCVPCWRGDYHFGSCPNRPVRDVAESGGAVRGFRGSFAGIRPSSRLFWLISGVPSIAGEEGSEGVSPRV